MRMRLSRMDDAGFAKAGTLSIGEFELIRRYFIRDDGSGYPSADSAIVLGIGDDAALLSVPSGECLVVTTDTLVAGVHFLLNADPADIAWKALAVNLSDLAAMSATPLAVTLNLTLPSADASWLAAFSAGFWRLADRHGVALVGGDTTRGPLSVTITAMGCVAPNHALRRSGAQVGDILCVTGSLGDAGAGLALAIAAIDTAQRSATTDALMALSPVHQGALGERLHRPVPRLAVGLAMRGVANAGMDISDGLLQDLGHLLSASGVGAELDVATLPLSDALSAYARLSAAARAQAQHWALSAGDDYELLLALSPEHWQHAQQITGVRLTAIGRVTKTRGVRLTNDGKPWEHAGLAGYQHF